MFNRLFRGYPQVIHKQLAHVQAQIDLHTQDVQVLVARCRRLETRIEELEELVSVEKAALHKLRGQVHGPKAQDTPRLPARQVQFATGTHKDELRRRAGIVAGRPAPHGEYDEEDPHTNGD